MTRSEIVAFFARRLETWNRLDAAALARDHTEDGVVESPFAGGTAVGREAIEKLYAAFFRAFSDLRTEQDDLLIDGNRVALSVRATGTDRGGLFGLAPTGRSIRVSAVLICELRDGLIAHERRVYDFTGLLVQVGAIKAKPA